MKDLVDYIVRSIVNQPDSVVVSEEKAEDGVHLSLQVAPEDMGVVIGRSGQNIKALRKLLTVRAMADNARVFLHLVEPEGGEAKPEETPE